MLQRLRNAWESIPALVLDAGLALVLGLLGAAQLMGHGPGRGPESGERPEPGGGGFPRPPGDQGPDTLTYLLVAGCAASLLPRSRYPWLSFAGVLAFGSMYLERGQNPFAILLIVLLAVYTAVSRSTLPRLPSIGLAVAGIVLLALALLSGDQPRDDAVWAMDAAWAAAAIFLGDATRSRRAFIAEAELRAAQAEVSHAEEARRHVTEERLQIARELHDVVAHNISLINVQAGVAAHLLEQNPQQAREAFVNIKQASHETLEELRAMVGVLREPLEGAKLRPTTGLAATDTLAQAVREAGQEVHLTLTGNRRALPSSVDLSAYRILQEALTNAVKHAPGAEIEVRIDFGADALSLEVSNEWPSSQREETGGFGIVGMRERAQALGGRLEAGPDGAGRFKVRAVLPLLSETPEPAAGAPPIPSAERRENEPRRGPLAPGIGGT
jgi:signal transduction histidine kinase